MRTTTVARRRMHAPSGSRRIAAPLAIATSVALVSLAPHTTRAAPSPKEQIKGKGGNFGLGLSVGDPTGASMKLFLHPNHALQWSLGWAPWHFGAGRAHMDYLWHPGTFTSNSVMALVGYLGLGLGVAFWGPGRRYWCDGPWDDYRYCRYPGRGGAGLFIRAPALGLAFHWQKVPLDTVIEAAWTPIIAPPWSPAHADFFVAARYYF